MSSEEGLFAMKDIKSEQDLLAAIEQHGVVTVPSGTIRDIFGHGRLAVHVRLAISDHLDKMGLAHYPDEFPGNQYTFVRIVRTGSDIDKVIQAASNPSPKNDNVLIDASTAAQKLAALKEAIGNKLK